jgi:hypothetical protein
MPAATSKPSEERASEETSFTLIEGQISLLVERFQTRMTCAGIAPRFGETTSKNAVAKMLQFSDHTKSLWEGSPGTMKVPLSHIKFMMNRKWAAVGRFDAWLAQQESSKYCTVVGMLA